MSLSGTGCPGRRDLWTALGLVTLDIPEGGPLSKGSALEGSEPQCEGEWRPCGLITDAPFQETLTPRPVFSQYY